nr:hypothetical protein [Tanacetum cinerariifolium]
RDDLTADELVLVPVRIVDGRNDNWANVEPLQGHNALPSTSLEMDVHAFATEIGYEKGGESSSPNCGVVVIEPEVV